MTDLLNVPGASRTSDAFRRAFSAMVDRHGWNGDGIAAVISNESGFKPDAKNPLPKQTAVGLIQFLMSTLQGLGWTGTRDEFAALSDVEQLPFVEHYYQRALGDGAHRPVDYYLATWGAPAGLPMEHVLASEGEKTYELNKGLDRDHSGTITVADLDAFVQSNIAKAGGVRLPPKASRSPSPPPAPSAPAKPASGSSRSQSAAASLPVLRLGSAGPAVRLWAKLIGVRKGNDVYDTTLEAATVRWQKAKGFTGTDVDGEVGPKTWSTAYA